MLIALHPLMALLTELSLYLGPVARHLGEDRRHGEGLLAGPLD